MPIQHYSYNGSQGVRSGRIFWLVLMVWPMSQVYAIGAAPLMLWFDQPATDWERESLPIGNGALGGAVKGGIDQELIQFNEKTLWTGGPGSAQGYDFGIP